MTTREACILREALSALASLDTGLTHDAITGQIEAATGAPLTTAEAGWVITELKRRGFARAYEDPITGVERMRITDVGKYAVSC